jgi:hypothetical protein
MPRQSRGSGGDSNDDAVSGSDAVQYAVSDFIGNKEIAKSAAEWISAKAKTVPREPGIVKLSLWLGFLFGLAIFVGICVLAYLQVLDQRVVAGLLGTLIGYWFGQRQKSN